MTIDLQGRYRVVNEGGTMRFVRVAPHQHADFKTSVDGASRKILARKESIEGDLRTYGYVLPPIGIGPACVESGIPFDVDEEKGIVSLREGDFRKLMKAYLVSDD